MKLEAVDTGGDKKQNCSLIYCNLGKQKWDGEQKQDYEQLMENA